MIQEVYENDNIINNKRIITKTIKTPFIDENGILRGIIGISSEITKEKLLEQKVQNNRKMKI